MDTNEIETTETAENFGVEIGKAFVISLATSAGTLAAFMIVGVAVDKVRKSRAFKSKTTNDETK